MQASKKLDLWTLPEVLIVHLKRFSFTARRRLKLDNPVSFPLTGLDMRDFVMRDQASLQPASDPERAPKLLELLCATVWCCTNVSAARRALRCHKRQGKACSSAHLVAMLIMRQSSLLGLLASALPAI